MGRFGIGQAYRRIEDQRLLTGAGQYTDDVSLPGEAYVYFLRSPYAHGEIREIDTADAKNSPGVLGVFTIEDLDAAGVKDLPVAVQMPDVRGIDPVPTPRPVLARGRVRYLGEPLAAIVADSRHAAEDAAELVMFDIDELPVVASLQAATAEGAALVWSDARDNLQSEGHLGDAKQTEDAFDRAAHTVEIDLVNNRLAPTPMEVRGCVAQYDPEADRYTLYQGCQSVHVLREWAAGSLGVKSAKLRVISPDVGGGFGMRFYLQNEPVVALYASRMVGRSVKWIATRSEGFAADTHGRDNLVHAELALDSELKFIGLRATVLANIGAYHGQSATYIPWTGYPMACGAYAIPAAHVVIKAIVTNTVPVDAYRGAGRPEAAYMVERLVDKAARQLGVAADEIRRRNFPAEFPHASPLGPNYDSGDYGRLLDECMQRAEWQGFTQRREESAARGQLRGLGLCYYVEVCAMPSDETPQVVFNQDDTVSVFVGTQSTGQGHETSYAQMVGETLGLGLDAIKVVQGDSDALPWGNGSGGSRTMSIGGSALMMAVQESIDQGTQLAADVLEVGAADIEFDEGNYTVVGTDRTVGLGDMVRRSYAEQKLPEGVAPGLEATARFASEDGNYPNGCHICEVEVDPETGVVEILRYTAEDDFGTVINPLILEGQVMGGVAQGLGQALMEHAVYEENGQLVSGTFMDYTMPRADSIPGIDFHSTPCPSPRNPLGVKGAGEAGTIGATPAVVNAVVDALGVTDIDMPLTSHTIWRAINRDTTL